MKHLRRRRVLSAAVVSLGALAAAGPAAPAAAVRVWAESDAALEIGGVSRLDRGAYFNVHGFPGNELSDAEAQTLRDAGVHYGRAFGVLWGLRQVEVRRGRLDPRSLRDVAERQNGSDRKLFERAGGRGRMDMIQTAHPRELFPGDDAEGVDRLLADPSAAGRALADYFKARRPGIGGWFEPLNEGNVKAAPLKVDWGRMIELHVRIARAFRKARVPVRVGGPAAAWPAFEKDGFGLWRRDMGRFIEEAGKHVDFLSVHLYGRSGANVDAILDLMENASLLAAGEVKPIVISEYGGAVDAPEGGAYHAPNDWALTHVSQAMTLQFMARPDRMPKNVPFHSLKAKWFKGHYPYSLFRSNDGNGDFSSVLAFYTFWNGVAGDRFPAGSDDPDVRVAGLRDGRTRHLIVHNEGPAPVTLDLAPDATGPRDRAAATVHRAAADGGAKVATVELPAPGTSGPTPGPGETLRITGPRPACAAGRGGVVRQTTAYGHRIVQPLNGEPVGLRVNLDGPAPEPEAVRFAELRVGVGRPAGMPFDVQVRFNGEALDVPTDRAGDEAEIHAAEDAWLSSVRIPVPAALIRARSEVVVASPTRGGNVSRVTLTVGADAAGGR